MDATENFQKYFWKSSQQSTKRTSLILPHELAIPQNAVRHTAQRLGGAQAPLRHNKSPLNNTQYVSFISSATVA